MGYLITAVSTNSTKKKTKMQLLKFLLPFLLVASCSTFSLNALFSSKNKAEELSAEDYAEEEVEEEIDEEEESDEENEIEEDDEEEEEESVEEEEDCLEEEEDDKI